MSLAPDALRSALADRYRIESELGAGGMATVYLAEDIKHRRKVAVKVFRPELAATLGADRFTREIEVAARLQHPHILPVHDSGEAGGFLFYVMPLVEGISLRERLTQHGELPIADAIRILTELVEAVAYAHRQGVVHRDLKPDNIMLSGRHPMVMDFGIAKAVTAATRPGAPTTAGVALGTPAYMAPEQALADPGLDHRVDLYAIGAMGYELLTGQPPFTGMSPQQLVAAQVVESPAPISARRPTVPAALESILMRCLEKRPADRPQTAEEVLHALEALSTPGEGVQPTVHSLPTTPWPGQKVARRATWRHQVLAGAIVVSVVVGAIWLVGGGSSSGRDRAIPRETEVTSSGGVGHVAISPDGRLFAYTDRDQRQLVVKDLTDGAMRIVAEGTIAQESALLRWTDGGRALLLVGSDSTGSPAAYRYPLLTGLQERIELGDEEWVLLSPDGSRSLAWRGDGGAPLRLTTLATGEVREIALPDSFGRRQESAEWSPSGELFALATQRGFPRTSLLVLDVARGGWREVRSDSVPLAAPRWNGTDRQLYFVRGGRELMALSVPEPSRPLPAATLVRDGLSTGIIDIAPEAARLAVVRRSQFLELWVRKGAAGQMAFDSRRVFRRAVAASPWGAIIFGVPMLSPDGRRVAMLVQREGMADDRKSDLFAIELDGGGARPIKSDFDGRVAWSPRSDELAVSDDRSAIHLARASDGGSRNLPFVQPGDGLLTWAPSGQLLIKRKGDSSLRFVDPSTARDEVFGPGDSTVSSAEFSPDGRWVWLRQGGEGAIVGLSDRTRVSTERHWFVGWAEDSRSAFFWKGGNGRVLLQVEVRGGVAREFTLPFFVADCRVTGTARAMTFVCNSIETTNAGWVLDGFDRDAPGAQRR